MLSQHDAIYYAHSGDLWDICAPLLRQQAAEGWGWRYIADEHQPDQVAEALRVRGVAVDDGGIVPAETLGFHASPVRVVPIIAALRDLLLRTPHAHPRGVLLLVEMTWAIRSPSGAVYLRAYEAALHDLLQQHPARAVCLYNQTALLDAQLLLSLHMHQSVQLPAGPHANPFFVPLEICRRRDERAQFLYWLNTIQPRVAQAPAPAPSAPAPQPVYDLETPALFIARNSDQASGRSAASAGCGSTARTATWCAGRSAGLPPARSRHSSPS
jgi:hypothetical protein